MCFQNYIFCDCVLVLSMSRDLLHQPKNFRTSGAGDLISTMVKSSKASIRPCENSHGVQKRVNRFYGDVLVTGEDLYIAAHQIYTRDLSSWLCSGAPNALECHISKKVICSNMISGFSPLFVAIGRFIFDQKDADHPYLRTEKF